MKRFLIIAAAAGAILVSCAKTETVNVSDAKYIGFDNAYIGNPTKAVEEVSTANIDHFYVFGGYDGPTTVFENVEVSKSANAWTYTYQKPWVDDQYYKFAAYYDDEPLTTTTNVSFDYVSGHLTLTGIVINPDNQVDMLYAENDFGSSGVAGTVRDKVQFSFSHILSMVQFTINSGFGDGVNVTITDFDFSGMDSKATYSYTDKMKWSDATDEIAENNGFKLFQTDNIATVSAGVSKPAIDNCIVMPQGLPTGENIKATFTVTVTGTGITTGDGTNIKEITAIIPLGDDKSWEPGYRYNYIATIDGQTMNYIEFDAPEVSQWINEDINMVNDGTTNGQIVGE